MKQTKCSSVSYEKSAVNVFVRGLRKGARRMGRD